MLAMITLSAQGYEKALLWQTGAGGGVKPLYAFSLDWLMMTDIFLRYKGYSYVKMCVKALNVKTEAAFSLPIFSTVRSEASLYGIPYHRFDSQKRLAVHHLQHKYIQI